MENLCGGDMLPASRSRPARSTIGRFMPRRDQRSRPIAADGSAGNSIATPELLIFETIGGKIIECHLRFTDQWPDLYGEGWIEAVVALYSNGVWRFNDADRRTGYSVVLFAAHGVRYKIDRTRFHALIHEYTEVSSI